MNARLSKSVVPRFDTIDLLRGLSVLGIIYLHINNNLASSSPANRLPPWIAIDFASIGGYGVHCFFAISGYLITLTLIRRFGSLQHVSPAAFYRIRFARIAPLLVLLLCVLSVLHAAHVPAFSIDPHVSTLPRAIFAVVTFQFNRLQAMHGWFPPAWVVLWSLSIEETFYLFYPLVCLLLLRRRWGWPVFLCVLGCLVLAGPFARTHWYAPGSIWSLESYLTNMDNIALGCLFALLAGRLSRNARWERSILPLLIQPLGAAIMFLTVLPGVPWMPHLERVQHMIWNTAASTTVLGFGTCLILLGITLRASRGSRWTAPVRSFGRYSYEIYLTHEFAVLGMVWLLTRMHREPSLAWLCATLALAGGLGFVIAHIFSEPLNRILRGAPLPYQLRPSFGPQEAAAGVGQARH